MGFKMFHTPKPKKFNYTPRYYDERKEELNMLKRKHGIMEGSEQDKKMDLKYRLQKGWQRKHVDVKRERSSTIRLVIILIGLLALAFYFLYS